MSIESTSIMPTTPKKPSANGAPDTSGRRTPVAPSGAAKPNSSPNNATGGIRRERSVRNGVPVSARAAIRRPADLSDDEAKMELQAKVEELKDQLRQSQMAHDETQKYNKVLKIKLDDASKDYGMLEEQTHEYSERVEQLETEKKDVLRARRELEQIYEADRAASMKQQEETQAREEEMQMSMQRMKDTLARRESRERSGLDEDGRPSPSRNSSYRGGSSPRPEGTQFAPTSLERSDSRSSSRLLINKDRIIEGLRLELAEAHVKLVELENKGGGSLQRLEKEMYKIKVQNARLMEENESFQLLLSEKTLNGEMGQSELLRAPENHALPSSLSPILQGTCLADELEGVDGEDAEPIDDGDRRLQAEVNSLKEQNKALTLYINNIVSRLLQHEQFEQILDQTPDLMAGPGALSQRFAASESDKELPPPPPPKDEKPATPIGGESQQTGAAALLQRAKTVMGATGKKARPQSAYQGEYPVRSEEPTLHENPDTAPRIPLTRSASSRGRNSHKRGHSDWPAASVVTNMYKGPSSGRVSAGSPGLGSPTSARTSFFASAQPLGNIARRSGSASQVPTISEVIGGTEKEAADVDSKPTLTDPTSSERNSVASATAVVPIDIINRAESQEWPASPSSPPRSTASSDERGKPSGGAVMIGSRPRPLRLLQETQNEDKARKAENRGSWFGWMNKGGVAAVQAASSAPSGVPRRASGEQS